MYGTRLRVTLNFWPAGHVPSARCIATTVLALVVTMQHHPVDASDDSAAVKHFEQHVRPLLVGKCLKCHGEKKQEGSLRLDSLDAMLEGGDSGPTLVRGGEEESLILEAIRYESFEMPPSGQLSDEEIRHFEKWIQHGAIWPAEDGPLRESGGEISKEDREWWAFQPLSFDLPKLTSTQDLPEAQPTDWRSSPIDSFVHRRLSEKGMEPAPIADRETLIRRVYFDLLGVPPTSEEVRQFVNDPAEDAWERLVDRLLEDQRYGEHWARFWLDLVRYSESDGWNQDAYRPDMWRYRDYVVDAFNDDKPYPQFVREQLAGDEIDGDDPEDLAAVGFLRLGIYEYNQRDARGHWDDIMNEMTDVVGDVFLGMGMACARCHDHKFDPLLQRDYFQLRAFFEPVIWRDDQAHFTQDEWKTYQEELAAWEAATENIRSEIDSLLEPYYKKKWKSTVAKFPVEIQECFHTPVEERTSWEHQMAYLVSRQFEEEGGGPLRGMSKEDKKKHEALQEKLEKFKHLRPDSPPGLMTVSDFDGEISPTIIPEDPQKEPVPPGFLTVMSPPGESTAVSLPQLPDSTGRRTALARWIGRGDNPLTMRVIVNRTWQQHFGSGLVATPNDFGRMGARPTHPELLDWLTTRFISEGWSFKKLHKEILMSATWRQSSEHPREARYQELDPGETLLWRFPVRRLKAEQIRDAILQCSGELVSKYGGPSVDAEKPRRGLYVKHQRNTPNEFLHGFDAAAGLKSVSERTTTTTPTQALLMINGPYVLDRAAEMSERLLNADEQPEALIVKAVRMTWGRNPSQRELDASLQFLFDADSAPRDSGAKAEISRERLTDFCHVLLNSNEFLYLD